MVTFDVVNLVPILKAYATESFPRSSQGLASGSKRGLVRPWADETLTKSDLFVSEDGVGNVS